MPNKAQQQLYIILLIVLLGFIGNSIAYPIFAPLFLHHAHGDIVPSSFNIKWRGIFMGITLMMYPLGQFFGSPILGAMSDQYGRKIVLLISAVLMTIFYLLTAISLSTNTLWLLISSRFLTGCTEGNISIARAMAVDNKDLDKHRSLGLINAMSSIGYIIGPLIGGLLADNKVVPWFNFALPFYAVTIIALITIILIITALKETRIANTANEQQRINIIKELNIIGRLKKLGQNRVLKFLLLSSTLASLSYDTFYEFYPAYMTGFWHATSVSIAWYTAILSTTIAISCGWLSHFLGKHFHKRSIILYSMPIITLMVLSLFFMPKPLIAVMIFIIIGFAIGVATTNFTLQVSDSAAATIQGEVLGTLWGLRMLCDAMICLVGGIILTISFKMPLIISIMASSIAWIVYYKNLKQIINKYFTYNYCPRNY